MRWSVRSVASPWRRKSVRWEEGFVYRSRRFERNKKMFLSHPLVNLSIVGNLRDREVACSASDRQGSNFEKWPKARFISFLSGESFSQKWSPLKSKGTAVQYNLAWPGFLSHSLTANSSNVWSVQCSLWQRTFDVIRWDSYTIMIVLASRCHAQQQISHCIDVITIYTTFCVHATPKYIQQHVLYA